MGKHAENYMHGMDDEYTDPKQLEGISVDDNVIKLGKRETDIC